MSENTSIEWCDHTLNPWIGCAKVSPGCDNCYAARQDAFRHWTPEGWGGPRKRTSEAAWRQPVKWNAAHDAFAAVHGRRQRVFCASLADVFDNQVPVQWRVDLFRLIAATPNLDWLLLTKRIGNAWPMMLDVSKWCQGGEQPMENIWLGATVVNQEEADRDIPKLLAVPARVRFLSMEPMLGPVDLQKPCTARCPNGDCFRHSSGHRVVVDSENGGTLMECICSRLNGLHWVIAGGESGPKARPAHPDWFRSLRDQCAAAGVAFFMKQMGGTRDKRGALEDLPEDLRIRSHPQ
jgi:protein gp37